MLRHPPPSLSSARGLILLLAAMLTIAGCGVGGGDTGAGAAGTEPVLQAPCLTTDDSLTLPTTADVGSPWIASDVSPNETSCWFVIQGENLADTTVIAGELFFSGSGRSFEETTDLYRQGLQDGAEADILALQLLNSGATGRNLAVLEEQRLEAPNAAVVLRHESDRSLNGEAFTAVVAVPDAPGPETQNLVIWAVANDLNAELIIDLINSLTLRPLDLE